MNARLRLTLFLTLVTACGQDAMDPGLELTTCPISAAPGAPGGIPSPTFAAHILPALQASCGSQSTTCHGAPSGGELPKGKIEFATHAGRTAADVRTDLVNVTPNNAPPAYVYVKPGDLSLSWLYVKVTQDLSGDDGYGARMPFGVPNLCIATTDTLAAWITQGAAP